MQINVFCYEARDWQKSAFRKIDRCLASNESQIMPVNATVGSGKTDLACYSFGKHIEDNINGKTISVFVSPRVKLCKQQNDSISRFIGKHSSLKEGVDYKIIAIDNTSQEFDRHGEIQAAHVIFVFCEASLWGSTSDEDADAEIRWNMWCGKLKHWADDFGYKLGAIFYDEAHNYERKVDKIMKLSEMFKLTMLASGTPAYFQKELSKKHKKNVCECSPAEAMEQKMICKPSLNMIHGNAEHDFPYAIKAVLKREIEKCKTEVFIPAMLVNCNSIDQIKSILDHEWISSRIGKEFNVITIHSTKAYSLENKCVKLDSSINGEAKTSEQAYDAIEKIDRGYFSNSLPIIVFQVGMIGEGINVSSFNSVIITTHSDRTAMQQIGRAVRNCYREGKSKVNDGHANVYAFFENIGDLQQLLVNLQSYDLTAECYDWGKQVDICTGSGLEHNDENDMLGKLTEFKWNDFDAIDIEEIMRAADLKFSNRKRVEFVDNFMEENAELVQLFMDALKESGYAEVFGGINAKEVDKCDVTKIAEEVKAQKDKRAQSHLNGEAESKRDMKAERREAPHVTLTKDVIIEMIITIQQYARSHKKVFNMMKSKDMLQQLFGAMFGSDVIGMFFSRILPKSFIDKFVSR